MGIAKGPSAQKSRLGVGGHCKNSKTLNQDINKGPQLVKAKKADAIKKIRERLLQVEEAYKKDNSRENQERLNDIKQELNDVEMSGTGDGDESNEDESNEDESNEDERNEDESNEDDDEPPAGPLSADVPLPSIEKGNVRKNTFEVGDILEISTSGKPMNNSTNSEIIHAFQKAGRDSNKLITRYGPRNAPYWNIEQNSTGFDKTTTIDLKMQNMVNIKDPETGAYPKITGRIFIQGVAISAPGRTPLEALELLRPKRIGEKRNFPETQVRIRFIHNGNNMFKWETRTDLSRLFSKRTDDKIFQAFTIQVNAYQAWLDGNRKSENRSPTPVLAWNSSERRPSERSPSPNQGTPGNPRDPIQIKKSDYELFTEVGRDWCMMNQVDDENMDKAFEARIIRVWQLYKRDNPDLFA